MTQDIKNQTIDSLATDMTFSEFVKQGLEAVKVINKTRKV